jgi:hypothetical protein
MDQFAFMVDTLIDYRDKVYDNLGKEDEEATNESLAMVESTLLHGYTIREVTEYKTTLKRITEKV